MNIGIEDLLQDSGGFGRFQIIFIATVFYNKLAIGWSMLQMSYAGYIPDWHCGTSAPDYHSNQTAPRDNTTIKQCDVNNTWTDYQELSCDDFSFDEPSVTVVTEWNLICDRKYIKQMFISVQMAGLLVGCFLSGQLGDSIGRKKTLYLFVLYHSVMNIITAFSDSWIMFAVCRMLIGFGVGGILVVVFTYPIEFLPLRWRPILSIMPVWVTGVCIFAVCALLLDNWSHLHISCGVFGLPGLIGYIYAPESMRWLTVKGRIKEAEEVLQKICSSNRKEMPPNAKRILEKVYRHELEVREKSKKYSYIDVFRGWYMFKITSTFAYFWCALSLIYYGISFGVSSLAGNLYLNIFLVAVVEVPAQISTFYFVNKLGRKWTAFTSIVISLVGSVGCLLAHFLAPSDIKGRLITGLSLTVKMGIGSCWSVFQTWGVELYPTVTRNLGYGVANTAARIGGIIAPFAIDFDNMKVVAYSIILMLVITTLLLILATPETKGQVLADSLESSTKHDYKPETNDGTQTYKVDKEAGVFSVELQVTPKKTSAKNEKTSSEPKGDNTRSESVGDEGLNYRF